MPLITKNDFLNPLFSLNPFIVALIIWSVGWGSLFLIAWRTDSISAFLRHPGFMIGDFLMLPLTGFLITYFYQAIRKPLTSAISVRLTYFAAITATVYLVFSLIITLFITKNFHNIWSLPHEIFKWFMAYTLANFLFRGFLQLVYGTSEKYIWVIYLLVLFAIIVHLTIPIVYGPKTFPKLT